MKVFLIGTEQETPIILSLLLLSGFIFLAEVSEARFVTRKFSFLPAIFIPWNSVFAENMYLLCCWVHFPPFTKQESSSLCPGGTVTGVILSQFYLFYTKIQLNITLSSPLYRVLPNYIFCCAIATDVHTHPSCPSCALLVPSATSSICLALLYFVRNKNYDGLFCVHFSRHPLFLLSCFHVHLNTQQCIYSGTILTLVSRGD